jgi:hypothetical protein
MQSKLFDMKLHEKIENDNFHIIRVPGGWIYRFFELRQELAGAVWSENYVVDSVFVPSK